MHNLDCPHKLCDGCSQIERVMACAECSEPVDMARQIYFRMLALDKQCPLCEQKTEMYEYAAEEKILCDGCGGMFCAWHSKVGCLHET